MHREIALILSCENYISIETISNRWFDLKIQTKKFNQTQSLISHQTNIS